MHLMHSINLMLGFVNGNSLRLFAVWIGTKLEFAFQADDFKQTGIFLATCASKVEHIQLYSSE